MVKRSRVEHRWACSICGQPHDRARDRARTQPASYCHDCHAAYMREHRPRHSEMSAEQRLRANCRAKSRIYAQRHGIEPEPCENCGSTENIERHHEDYRVWKDWVWLCRRCHRKAHRHERRTRRDR